LARESCPRRYCWYWHTLAFDWDIKSLFHNWAFA
jgi:hypothetical protein